MFPRKVESYQVDQQPNNNVNMILTEKVTSLNDPTPALKRTQAGHWSVTINGPINRCYQRRHCRRITGNCACGWPYTRMCQLSDISAVLPRVEHFSCRLNQMTKPWFRSDDCIRLARRFKIVYLQHLYPPSPTDFIGCSSKVILLLL